jgi:hypothetical protein
VLLLPRTRAGDDSRVSGDDSDEDDDDDDNNEEEEARGEEADPEV